MCASRILQAEMAQRNTARSPQGARRSVFGVSYIDGPAYEDYANYADHGYDNYSDYLDGTDDTEKDDVRRQPEIVAVG